MTKSYVAQYRSLDHRMLLGGKSWGQSSRFASRTDAQSHLDAVLEINRSAGVVIAGEVYQSNEEPEIEEIDNDA